MMKMKSLLVVVAVAMAMLGFKATPASAVEMADGHKFYGYYQLWIALSEDSENAAVAANGDDGEDSAFGFQERRARFGAKGKMMDGMIGYNFFTEWANQSISMLDYWGTISPSDTMQIRFGRFRPMVNYEGSITSSFGLQMMERSQIGKNHSGYMTPFGSFRDLGVELQVKTEMAVIKLSATNGLGNKSNAAVGGDYREKFVSSNAMLDAMYTIGIIAKPSPGLTVHAAYAMNKHDNAVAAAGEEGADAVVDIDRTAYSAGFLYKADSGLYLDAEYFFGERGEDDFKGEDETKGYFFRAGYWVVPKTLVVSARYDVIEKGKDNATEDKQTSVSASYWVGKFAALLEYSTRELDSSDDDVTALRARLQVKF